MFTMNFHTFATLASLYAMYVSSAPTNNKILSVYDALVNLETEDKYKCPYMRKSLLLEPEPEFLKYCLIPEEVDKIKKFNPMLTTLTLCMVYMESFKTMCAVSPKLTDDEMKSLFNNNLLNSTLTLEETCSSLKYRKSVDVKFKPAFTMMNDESLCRTLCRDPENQTIQVCEWSAYLLNIAANLETKEVPNKPTFTVENSKNVKQNNPPVLVETDKGINADHSQNNPLILAEPNKGISADHSQQESVVSEKPNKSDILKADPTPKTPPPQEMNGNEGHSNAGGEVQAITGIEGHSNAAVEVPASEDKVTDEEEPNPASQQVPDQRVDEAEASVKDQAKVEESRTGKTVTNTSAAVVKPDVKPSTPVEEAVEQPIDAPGEVSPSIEPKTSEKTQAVPQISDTAQNIDLDDKEEEKKTAANIAYEDEEEDDGDYSVIDNAKTENKPLEKSKPLELEDDKLSFPGSYSNQNIEEDDSYFFSYFMMICIVFILGYVGYHNKQKILAIVLEGRKGKRQQRRRPNSANYHKLDSNLEEAVTSACNKNTANIIY